MKKILLIQGANVKYRMETDPELHMKPSELDERLYGHAKEHAYDLDILYTNREGEAIDKIYQSAEQAYHGIVMNPGGFAYAGYALRDCLSSVALPYMEVHMSNIAKHDIQCVLSTVSKGTISGFGWYGYILAIEAMLNA